MLIYTDTLKPWTWNQSYVIETCKAVCGYKLSDQMW